MMTTTRTTASGMLLIAMLSLTLGACGKKPAPVARPTPPPPGPSATVPDAPPAPPERVAEAAIVPPEATMTDSSLSSRSLDDLNRQSPLQPAFFDLDSSDLSSRAQAALTANADVLKKYPSWVVTVEGHCDERGTAQYNLALGERRAMAAKNYMQSLGIAADRMKTVSYGKEFPFDPARTEEAWAKNRRAHFVITAK